MAYETASANDPNDLIDKLRIFALANGWTVDYNGGRTNPGGALQAGSNNAVAMNKGGLYVVFYQDTSSNTTANPTPRVANYTYPGPWVSTNGTDAQANKTQTTLTNKLSGPYVAYHFFTDPARNYLHCALEVVAGRFAHFHVGTLDKSGGGQAVAYNCGLRWDFTTTPTPYISQLESTQHGIPFDDNNNGSSSWTGTALRVDSDGIVPRNQYMYYGDGTQAKGGFIGAGSQRLMSHMLRIVGASTLTGRAPLLPLIVMSSRSSGVYSVVGTPFDLRVVRLDNLAAGEVLTIGSDSWKCFPLIRRSGTTGIENSDFHGYAYRIVP